MTSFSGITKEKIAIFKKFGRDADFWIRLGSKKDKKIMSDDDWGLIESLIQDIHIINTGNASEEFCKRVDAQLKKVCENNVVIEEVKKLARKH